MMLCGEKRVRRATTALARAAHLIAAYYHQVSDLLQLAASATAATAADQRCAASNPAQTALKTLADPYRTSSAAAAPEKFAPARQRLTVRS